MDRRTRILASVFGLVIAYALVSGVVYPRWIEPLLTIDQTIAQREEHLDELQKVEAKVQDAKWEYRDFVQRVGTFDVGKAEHDLRERLNGLIEKHGLEETNVGVRHFNPDRKTKLEKMSITVGATGALESTVSFLKDLSELPHVASLTNPTISPTSSLRRQGLKTNRVKLSAPLEVWVLPQQRIVGIIQSEQLVQPESWVRHEDRSYSVISELEPFWPPIPLTARIKRKSVTVDKDESASLEVIATGGEGEYGYLWEGEGELTSPEEAETTVDTSTPGTFEYAVTVTDDDGHTATATAKVTVRERPKPVVEGCTLEDDCPEGQVCDVATGQCEEPLGPQRWKDGKHIQLTMALIRKAGAERFGEVMVYNGKSKQTDYYTVSDEFDGGEVVFVHQTGALVRRQDEYFVYPIGAKLNEDVAADEAADYPRLQEVARYLQEAAKPRPEPETEGVQASASDGDSPGDSTESPGAQTAEGDAEQGGSTGSPPNAAADEKDKAGPGDAPVGVTKGQGDAPVGVTNGQGDKPPPSGAKSTAQKGKRKREPTTRPDSRKRRSRNTKEREKKD